MAFYIILPISFLFIGEFLNRYINIDGMRHKLKTFIPGIILFMLSSFRGSTVGTDSENYLLVYELVQNYEFAPLLFEPNPLDYYTGKGYLFVNKVFSYIIPHEQTIMVISSLIILFGISLFIYYYSKDAIFSWFLFVALYFLAYSFNLMRQFVAISLAMVAIHFFIKGWKLVFAGIILLTAFLFHSSAIIVLSLIVIDMFKMTKKNLKVLLSLMAVATGILYFNFEFLLNYTGRYQRYIGTYYFSEVQLGGTYLIWLAKLAAIIFLYYKFNEQLSLSRQKEVYFSALFIGISLFIEIIGSNLLIVGRLSYYFDIFLIIIIPNVLFHHFDDNKYLKYASMGLFLAYYTVMLRSNHSEIIPYRFVF